MTLESSLSKAVFNGNGTATEFAFTFKVWDDDQIAVTVSDPDGYAEDVTADATIVLDADSGGTVTYLLDGEPLPSGYKLAITRNMPFLQRVDLVSATRFDPQVMEDALDTATAERQELKEQLARAVILPPTSEQTPEEYMVAFQEAVRRTQDNRDWVEDAIEEAGQGIGDSTFVTSTGSTTTRTLADRFADVINVKDFGAKGDGITDDTAAMQSAQEKGSIYLPAGTYKVDTLPLKAAISGGGDLLYKHMLFDAKSLDDKYPFENYNLTAIDVDLNHNGLNSHLFYDASEGRIQCVYRTSPYHGVHVSEYVKRESYDGGQTWGDKTTVYFREGYDCRCSVSYCDDDVWVILLANRVPSSDNDVFGVPKSLVSTDRGKTWSVYSDISYSGGSVVASDAVPGWNFHGAIYKIDGKLIAYAYDVASKNTTTNEPIPQTGNITAFVSVDNGASWTVYENVITKTVETGDLSETTIAKVGNQLVAFTRTYLSSPNCAISLGTDTTGLSFGSPFISGIPLGQNPYSSIIEEDKNRSWILFSNRKNSLNGGNVSTRAQYRNELYILLVDQDLLDTNFEDYKVRKISVTPHYSVGHFWSAIKANGRYIGVVNAGEVNGTCASLYCLTNEIPVPLSRGNIYDIMPNKNLLVNGGFNIARFSDGSNVNMRSKYFCDGWMFFHSNSKRVTYSFENKYNVSFTSHPDIVSSKYLTFSLNDTSLISVINMMPVASLGFKRPVTLSFYAKASASGVQVPSIYLHRKGGNSGYTETVEFLSISSSSDDIELKTFWKKYVFTIYGFHTAILSISDYSDAGSYDCLYFNFTSDIASTNVYLADVKLEFSSYASPFVVDEIQEKSCCDKFYAMTMENIGQVSSEDGALYGIAVGTEVALPIRYPVKMARKPTVTVYSTQTGDSGKMYNATTQQDVAATVVNDSTLGCIVRNSANLTAGDIVKCHIVADARPSL